MASGNSSGFDTKLVKDLAKILRDTDLTEIEVEHQGTMVRVARTPAAVTVQAHAAAPAAPVAQAPAAAAPAEAARHPGAVPSPMVGTIYLQPEPGAAAFVKVGDTVKDGQQLFIIEAMKTMNPVAAPHGGLVQSILVVDGQPVEFGEPLCIIA
jgi:acetyl-CoA carboxylase biotin carboxyl carrier protein